MLISKALVVIEGKVITEPQVQKDYGVEQICEVILEYTRLSGKKDKFIVNFSSNLGVEVKSGMYIKVIGDLRSLHIPNEEGKKPSTKIYVMASVIEELIGVPEVFDNMVTLSNCELFRKPNMRKDINNENVTIADIVLKAQRKHSKVSYIPCSAWNNNARFIGKLTVPSKLSIKGRLQSHITKSDRIMTEVAITNIDWGSDED